MSRVIAQQAAKVTVYDAETGAPLSRWSVDADELVRVGAATREPPVLSDPAETDTPSEDAVVETAEPQARPKRKR